jgi:hypothetical protein
MARRFACDENGLSVFEMICWRRHDRSFTLCAFDLIELGGEDMRGKELRSGSGFWESCCAALIRGSRSTSIMRAMAPSFTNTHARLAAKASFPNGSDRRTGRAVPIIG